MGRPSLEYLRKLAGKAAAAAGEAAVDPAVLAFLDAVEADLANNPIVGVNVGDASLLRRDGETISLMSLTAESRPARTFSAFQLNSASDAFMNPTPTPKVAAGATRRE